MVFSTPLLSVTAISYVRGELAKLQDANNVLLINKRLNYHEVTQLLREGVATCNAISSFLIQEVFCAARPLAPQPATVSRTQLAVMSRLSPHPRRTLDSIDNCHNLDPKFKTARLRDRAVAASRDFIREAESLAAISFEQLMDLRRLP